MLCDTYQVRHLDMATADQLKALIRSHSDGDDERFYATAMQVAAQAARQGHIRFAQELRDLVDSAKAKALRAALSSQRTRPTPVVQPRGELAGLLSAVYPHTRLADMALEAPVREKINRILLEQRQRDRIHEHGFVLLRTFMFVGPPGTGKTTSSSHSFASPKRNGKRYEPRTRLSGSTRSSDDG